MTRIHFYSRLTRPSQIPHLLIRCDQTKQQPQQQQKQTQQQQQEQQQRKTLSNL